MLRGKCRDDEAGLPTVLEATIAVDTMLLSPWVYPDLSAIHLKISRSFSK